MPASIKISRKIVILLFIALSIHGCAAMRAMKKGDDLAAQGRWDEALDNYSDALERAPQNTEYRLKTERAKYEAATGHIKKGEEYLKKNNYDRAILEFQIALALNPALKRAQFMTVEAKKRKDAEYYYKTGLDFLNSNKENEARAAFQKALSLNPSFEEAKNELDKLMAEKKTIIGGFELNLKSDKPITLKFKNTPIQDIFSIISKLSGINFIFDEGVKNKKASIYIENATFEQAMDLLLMTNNLFQKIINENTIIIVPDTKAKRQQYQDLLIHTFYLSNLEAKKAVNLLRTLLQIKSIYVNEQLNTIIVRDTPEVVELADKILSANDLANSEMMLDVEILEVIKNDSANLGFDLNPDTLTMELVDPNSALKDKVTYNTLKRFSKSDLLFTVPDVVINLQKQQGNVNILANPKIRVANDKKAKIHIGDRIPIVTVTTNNGVTTDNVQYVDVGVKLNVEPQIHLDGEISLKLSLEISSLGPATTTPSGSLVYQIGTRNTESELRLHDGETQVIGGLISDEERDTTVKIPFLGDIPILGRLFSSVDSKGVKTDILLSLTPHIIRNKEIPGSELQSIWSGRSQEFSSSPPFESFTEKEPEVRIPPPDSLPEAEMPLPPGELPGAPSAGEDKSSLNGNRDKNGAYLTIDGPSSVARREEINLDINLKIDRKIVSAPFYLRYESRAVGFVGANEAEFMKSDGKSTSFMTSNDEKNGRVIVGISRLGDKEGLSGSGRIMTVTFKPKESGETRFYLENAGLAGVNGERIEAEVSDKSVKII